MSETLGKTVELNSRFNRLFRDGKLLQIHVSKWTMSSNLTEQDLPLAEGTVLPGFVKLGNKMIIDEKEFKKFVSVESTARSYLRMHAYQFPIAQAHFVPNRVLVAVLEKLEKFKVKYYSMVETFITNYEAHKTAMLAKYPDHHAVLLPCYPTTEFIRPKFGFHVVMFEVAFPKQMKEVDLASVQAEATVKEEMQQKFEAAWQQQYTQSLQVVDKFLSEAVTSTRGRIVDVFETIARKIRGREVISATNLKTMSSIIDAFDGLDFLDDKTVKANLSTVRTLLTSGRDFKEDRDAITSLGEAVDDVLAVARDMSDVDAITGDYIRRIEV